MNAFFYVITNNYKIYSLCWEESLFCYKFQCIHIRGQNVTATIIEIFIAIVRQPRNSTKTARKGLSN